MQNPAAGNNGDGASAGRSAASPGLRAGPDSICAASGLHKNPKKPCTMEPGLPPGCEPSPMEKGQPLIRGHACAQLQPSTSKARGAGQRSAARNELAWRTTHSTARPPEPRFKLTSQDFMG